MAVERLFDAEVAWFVEYEDAPSKILEHHYPGVPNLGDVTQIDWSEMGRKHARLHAAEGGDANDSHRIDILTGGYPRTMPAVL